MKNGSNILLIILIMLVCFGLGFGTFYYLDNQDTKNKEKDDINKPLEPKTEDFKIDDFKSIIDDLDMSNLTSTVTSFTNQQMLQVAANNLTKNSESIADNKFTKIQVEEFANKYFGTKLDYTDIALYGTSDISNIKYVLYSYDSTNEKYVYNTKVLARGGVALNAIYNNYIDVKKIGEEYVVSVNKLIPNVGTSYTDGKNELFSESDLTSSSNDAAIKYFKANINKYKANMPVFKYIFTKVNNKYVIKSYTIPEIDLDMFSV